MNTERRNILRWLTVTGAIAAIAAVVLVSLRTRSNERPKAINVRTATADVKPSLPVDKKPTPATPTSQPPTAFIDQTQPPPKCSQPTKAQLEQLKPPAAQGPLDVLKRVYTRESSDETSQATERLIREQLDFETFPSELLRNVTCHKSVCKISVYWSRQQPMIFAAIWAKVSPVLTAHIAIDPAPKPDRNGNVLTEMYILRAGLKLTDFI
jgi:hypothetical protein